jgi:hypothetical protein
MTGKVGWRVEELTRAAEFLGVPVSDLIAAEASA